MTTSTSVFAAAKAAIVATGVNAIDGPARDLPLGDDGLIAQFAVLWPGLPFSKGQRMSGGASRRDDAVTVICGGATVNDALAVANKVQGALDGLRTSPKGGPLGQTGGRPAEPEPNADPVRVSLALEYTTITKG